MLKPTIAGPLLVVSGAVLWGTTGTTQALAPESASPTAIGSIRLLVGGLCLLILALYRNAFSKCTSWPKHTVLLAAIGVAAYQPFFFGGVDRTGVAVGTVVAIGSAPVLAGVLGFLFNGEKPGFKWLLSTGLAVAGCVLLFIDSGSITVDATGVLMSLGAGLAYASYVITSKKLLDKNPPDAVIALVFCLSALMLLPFLLTQDLTWLVSWHGLAVAVHLGLIATALAYFLFARGLVLVPAATAVTLTLAEPLTAATLGIAMLGEQLVLSAMAGIMLLLVGLLVLSVDIKNTPKGVMDKHE